MSSKMHQTLLFPSDAHCPLRLALPCSGQDPQEARQADRVPPASPCACLGAAPGECHCHVRSCFHRAEALHQLRLRGFRCWRPWLLTVLHHAAHCPSPCCSLSLIPLTCLPHRPPPSTQPFLSTESISQLVKAAERHVQELTQLCGGSSRPAGGGSTSEARSAGRTGVAPRVRACSRWAARVAFPALCMHSALQCTPAPLQVPSLPLRTPSLAGFSCSIRGSAHQQHK